jgi:cell division protein FtsN
MTMKKTIAILLILIQMGLPMIAQQVYEGIAVRGRSGEFPSEGYYAASNSFPRNSLVEVRNPSTGATIEVIIVSGISEPGLFMILSDEASSALGVTQSNAISLVASPVSVPRLTSVAANQDLPFSSDPEVNPEAEFSDPNDFVFNPGAEVPEVANPLLQPRRDADDGEGEDSAVEDEDGGFIETPVSDEPRDIGTDDGFFIVEELEAPAIDDLFREEPVLEDEARVSEVPIEEPEQQASEAAEEVAPAEAPRIAEVPVAEESGNATPGLFDGLAEIRNDGITGDEPVTGRQARRIPEPVPMYSSGILSALSRIRDGSNAVSPDFALDSTPEYNYWPEEYEVEAPAEELAEEATVAETRTTEAAEAEEPETSLDIQDAGTEPIVFGAEVEPTVPPADDPAMEEPLPFEDPVIAQEEPAVEAEAGLASGGDYAEALGQDPAQEWIERIRNLYPDRQLFLPPAGTDLDEPLPRVASEDEALPRFVLNEADTPLNPGDAPETSLGVRRAAGEALPDSEIPEVGFDFEDELPSISLGIAPRPRSGALAVGELPLPEASASEIENSSLRTAAPDEGLPEFTGIPLAQYLDPRPNAGIGRIDASDSVLGTLASPPSPELPGERSPSITETPAEAEEEPTIESPLDPIRPEDVEITLEEADFRSPSIDTPDEPLDREVADDNEPVAELGEPGEPGEEEPMDAGDLLVYLEESEPRTPEEAGPVEEAPVEESPVAPVATVNVATVPAVPDIVWARENLPLIYTLEPEGYYLQVGAFANPRSAKRVVEEVAPGYPLAVQPVEGSGNPLYRVFVGPLEEDEKGTVLYWFRARGFRDAFIRKGI